MSITIREKPPWEFTRREKAEYETSGAEKQQDILDEVLRRKKQWTRDGRWKSWEEGRKRALRERRDYFKKHPDKKDSFEGV